MWRVFEVLGPLELESVVHPLGYAKIDFESGQDNQYKNGEYLIFPRVDHSYLKPFPVDHYDSFIKLLIKTVKEIHTKNVVHMDLYPSNLMIRYTSKVELRIIDWDVATFVGESFTDQMEERLSKSSLGSYYYKRNGSAEFKCDSWFVFVLASLNKEEIVRFCKEPDDRPKVFQDAVRRLYEKHEQELKNEVLDAWIEAHW
ncbi:hypothetical protein BC833DRAFT_570071 [Globomyces pollinis-pini]|nr:hypothetical protein BC833DRAFT_570071 [Globomyces pollinis-pini]